MPANMLPARMIQTTDKSKQNTYFFQHCLSLKRVKVSCWKRKEQSPKIPHNKM